MSAGRVVFCESVAAFWQVVEDFTRYRGEFDRRRSDRRQGPAGGAPFLWGYYGLDRRSGWDRRGGEADPVVSHDWCCGGEDAGIGGGV